MQYVHNAKGRLIAIILDNKTIKIIGDKCETIVNFLYDKPKIKSKVLKS